MAGKQTNALLKAEKDLYRIHASAHRQCDRVSEIHRIAHRIERNGINELDTADFHALHAMLHGEQSDNLETDALAESVLGAL